METELRKILTEIYRGQKENNDEAVERILLLFSVVGRREHLPDDGLYSPCDGCTDTCENWEIFFCKIQ